MRIITITELVPSTTIDSDGAVDACVLVDGHREEYGLTLRRAWSFASKTHHLELRSIAGGPRLSVNRITAVIRAINDAWRKSGLQ